MRIAMTAEEFDAQLESAKVNIISWRDKGLKSMWWGFNSNVGGGRMNEKLNQYQ